MPTINQERRPKIHALQQGWIVVLALVTLEPAMVLAQTAPAKVAYVEGNAKVFIQRHRGGELEPAEVGMGLFPGDTIVTRTGRAQVNLAGAGCLRLSANTVIGFPTLEKESALGIRGGKSGPVWESIQEAARDEVFEVRTPTLVAGGREIPSDWARGIRDEVRPVSTLPDPDAVARKLPAKIMYVEGKVFIKPDGSTAPELAEVGGTLFERDEIITGPGSNTLRLDGIGALHFTPNTVIRLPEKDAAGPTRPEGKDRRPVAEEPVAVEAPIPHCGTPISDEELDRHIVEHGGSSWPPTSGGIATIPPVPEPPETNVFPLPDSQPDAPDRWKKLEERAKRLAKESADTPLPVKLADPETIPVIPEVAVIDAVFSLPEAPDSPIRSTIYFRGDEVVGDSEVQTPAGESTDAATGGTTKWNARKHTYRIEGTRSENVITGTTTLSSPPLITRITGSDGIVWVNRDTAEFQPQDLRIVFDVSGSVTMSMGPMRGKHVTEYLDRPEGTQRLETESSYEQTTIVHGVWQYRETGARNQ